MTLAESVSTGFRRRKSHGSKPSAATDAETVSPSHDAMESNAPLPPPRSLIISSIILLVLALIVYNVMIFAGAVARFDRVVPDIVLAHAVAPGGEGDESSADASATVQTQILNAMEGYDLQIEVSSEQGAEASDGGLLSLSGPACRAGARQTTPPPQTRPASNPAC